MHKSVILSSKMVTIPAQGRALTLKVSGAVNDKRFDRPVTQLEAGSGRLVIRKRDKSEHQTTFKKCKLRIDALELPRGSNAINIEVTMGIPMASLSIGQSKIGIGRSRKPGPFKKYDWAKLHKILGYGEQVAKALGKSKGSEVHLLVLTPKNRPVVLGFDKNSPFAKLPGAKSQRQVNLLVIPGKPRILRVKN